MGVPRAPLRRVLQVNLGQARQQALECAEQVDWTAEAR